jgi:hypothetical protein
VARTVRYFSLSFKDTVGDFWVAARYNDAEGVFRTNTLGLMLQSAGGLKPQEVIGIYRRKADAVRAWKREYARRG